MRLVITNQTVKHVYKRKAKTTIILSKRNVDRINAIGKRLESYDKILLKLAEYDIFLESKKSPPDRKIGF